MKSHILAIVVVVLIVVFAGVFFYWQKSNLVPRPERFTELYFNNASFLPRETVAGKLIIFSFGIHNVEYATTTYPYEVYFESLDGARFDLATGTVTLASDASTTIPVSYTFEASNLTGEVVVDLPSQNNQSIDFLLPDND